MIGTANLSPVCSTEGLWCDFFPRLPLPLSASTSSEGTTTLNNNNNSTITTNSSSSSNHTDDTTNSNASINDFGIVLQDFLQRQGDQMTFPNPPRWLNTNTTTTATTATATVNAPVAYRDPRSSSHLTDWGASSGGTSSGGASSRGASSSTSSPDAPQLMTPSDFLRQTHPPMQLADLSRCYDFSKGKPLTLNLTH